MAQYLERELFLIMYMWYIYLRMGVETWVQEPVEARRRCLLPWSESYRELWAAQDGW